MCIPPAEKFALLAKPYNLAQQIYPRMKKLITMLVVAASLAACNGNGDAASRADSAISNATDSVKAAADSTAIKVDSTIRAAADMAKSRIDNAVDSAKRAIKK